MATIFTCDFCPDGKIDLLHGSGRQDIVYPSSYVLGQKDYNLTPRMKFRCQGCIDAGITTTQDGLTVHSAKEIKKSEAA